MISAKLRKKDKWSSIKISLFVEINRLTIKYIAWNSRRCNIILTVWWSTYRKINACVRNQNDNNDNLDSTNVLLNGEVQRWSGGPKGFLITWLSTTWFSYVCTRRLDFLQVCNGPALINRFETGPYRQFVGPEMEPFFFSSVTSWSSDPTKMIEESSTSGTAVRRWPMGQALTAWPSRRWPSTESSEWDS